MPPPVYLAYGLRITSDTALPVLPLADAAVAAADVYLNFRSAPAPDVVRWLARLESTTRDPWLACARTSTGYLLRFEGAADVTVSADGSEIGCTPIGDASDALLQHLVLDHSMPLALKLKGREALHATTVRTAQGTCAFVGPSGSGKSTLAAAFLHAGDDVLSDDCACVCLQRGRAYIVPAYPGVRVHADVRETLVMGKQRAQTTGRRAVKERWAPPQALDAFPRESQRLVCVYRLSQSPLSGDARRPRIESLSVRDGFMELVGSTFRFDALDRAMLAAEFDVWQQVARTVPVRRLVLADDLENEEARHLVQSDLASHRY